MRRCAQLRRNSVSRSETIVGEYIELPDPIPVVREWLVSHPVVGPLVTGCHTVLPPDVVWPAIRLTRVGGTPSVPFRVDDAHFQLDVFAGTEADAGALGVKVRAAMWEMCGWSHSTAHVLHVDELTGPRSVPDDSRTPPTPRVLMTFAVALRPIP